MHSSTIQGDQCVICVQNYTKDHSHSPTALKCGHVFGRSCIVERKEISSSCPVCRRRLAIAEDTPDTSLFTLMKKDFHQARIPYYALAASFLVSPCLVDMAGLVTVICRNLLCIYGAIRVCTPIANLIRGRLGCKPVKPLQLREVVAHGIVMCSVCFAGAIVTKMTTNPKPACSQ